jgi:hypothetical protein
MAKPHKLHAMTTILIIRPSQKPTSTSCHVKATEPCAYFYIWDFSLVAIMQRFSTQSNLNSAHMTWEHIFQAIYISFSDSYLIHEMSLWQKGTYDTPQDKARGLTFMMANEPLAPYDQNKLSNQKLSIAKPLKHVKIIKRHLLTREHTCDIFQKHSHRPWI